MSREIVTDLRSCGVRLKLGCTHLALTSCMVNQVCSQICDAHFPLEAHTVVQHRGNKATLKIGEKPTI